MDNLYNLMRCKVTNRSRRLIAWIVAGLMSVGIIGCSHSDSASSRPSAPDSLTLGATITNEPTARLERTFAASKSPIKALAFSPDGQMLVSGSLNGDTKIWNADTGELLRQVSDRPSIQSIAVSADTVPAYQSILLASGDDQGGIELHNLTTGELRQTLAIPETVVQSVAFSPNGQWLASGQWNGTVQLWDIETGERLSTLANHDYGVTVVMFAPATNTESPLLISADYDGNVKLWRSNNGELLRTFNTARYPVLALAISPDGKTLVTGNGDGTVKSWKLPSGRYIQGFLGHLDAVTALTISPDGQTLASSSRDKTIKLWDLATGTLIQTLSDAQMDSIMALAFSPNGDKLVSGDQAGMIQVWHRN
ncbi:WD40 repeat domain-containing protein [Thermocoleostomius sinensis]|uniref:WD40 repeat domain-containing protein n=1 Tax=Thermocoleostomius sinensis A174 TaxID=2016057 RepID=A0A9E9C3Q3_9CYAN|nr:WD40 repeat domain-containing protein [Thermocoleostomius sinensis]WAL59191.1 WD40 repeat domain-containing protein [Thermocoleostomius sinensis A174]